MWSWLPRVAAMERWRSAWRCRWRPGSPPTCSTSIDTSAAALSAAAPDRSRVAVAPDWHRLRTPADLARLDPGLEGWEETRVLLG